MIAVLRMIATVVIFVIVGACAYSAVVLLGTPNEVPHVQPLH